MRTGSKFALEVRTPGSHPLMRTLLAVTSAVTTEATIFIGCRAQGFQPGFHGIAMVSTGNQISRFAIQA